MRTLFVLVALLVAGFLALRHIERTRPQDLPWTPLDLTAPIGLATRVKLDALSGDPGGCRDALLRAGIRFVPIADRREGPACGYTNVLFLERGTVAYSPQPLRLSCPMLAALAVWERQVLRPEARRLLGSDVARIDHLGSYNCRRIAGGEGRAWSEHATANALDIAGVTLADGRTVTVGRDWKGDGAPSAFLHAAHDGACSLFGTTLGPDYNAAHSGHFHLDMKRWHACR